MKKLIATLILATMGFGFVAMAGLYPVYDLTLDGVNPKPIGTIEGIVDGVHNNAFPILEPNGSKNGYTIYTESESLTMNYQAKDTINRILPSYHGIDNNGTTYHNLAHVSFTTNQDTYLTLWTDIDHQATNEPRIDMALSISDYGIYFLDDGELHSMKNTGVEVEAGKEFGVYYKADTTYKNSSYNMGDPDKVGTVVESTIKTTENWVGSFDSGDHSLNSAWFADSTNVKTSSAFFCLFQGPYTEGQPAYLEWDHFEFGFATAERPLGQPLPGMMATILFSGFCAATLRKRTKKN